MDANNNDDLYHLSFIESSTGTMDLFLVRKMKQEYEDLLRTAAKHESEEKKKNVKQLSSLLVYLEKEKLISFSKLTICSSNIENGLYDKHKGESDSNAFVYIFDHQINYSDFGTGGTVVGIECSKKADMESAPYSYNIWFNKKSEETVRLVDSQKQPLVELGGIAQNFNIIIAINVECIPDVIIMKIYQELLKLLKK